MPAPETDPFADHDLDATLDAALDEAGVHDLPVENKHLGSAVPSAPAPESEAAAPAPPVASTGGIDDIPEIETTPISREPAPAPAGGGPLAGAGTAPENFEAPRNLSQKGTENWNKLKTLASTAKKEADEAKRQLSALQAQVTELQKSGGADPAIAARIISLEAELANYRAVYSTETSPEFKAQYDAPIAQTNDEIYKILVRQQLPHEQLEKIKASGGLANSPQEFTNFVDLLRSFERFPDGTPVPASVKALARMEASRLESLVGKIFDLQASREQALEAIPGNREKFTQALAEQQKQKYIAYDTALDTHWNQITAGIPHARLQQIPVDATPQQKAEIEKSNAKYVKLFPRVMAAKWPKTPQARAEVMATVGLAYDLSDDLDEAAKQIRLRDSKIAELTKKLSDIQKAGQTHGKGGAAPITPAGGPTPVEEKLQMSNEDAIEAGLAELGI